MRWIGVTALSAALLLPASAQADVLVNISKSQQRMAVSVDGAELYRWPVSTGRRGFATPNGSFHPVRLERHWYSRQYEMTPMPWSMFFFRGYAVHGTMEARNLGHAASHGCVRLRPDHAATLFSLMHKQRLATTRIVVTDGPLPAPPGATPMADAAPSPPVQVSATSFAKVLSVGVPADATADRDPAAGPAATPVQVSAASFAKVLSVGVVADARADRDPAADPVAPPVQVPAASFAKVLSVDVVADARADHDPAADPAAPRGDVAAASPRVRAYEHLARETLRGDESEVLRGRQAWLRQLARKYGFNHW